jgi:hypothetical protein
MKMTRLFLQKKIVDLQVGRKFGFFMLGGLILATAFFVSACSNKVEKSQYMDRPSSDGKYYYNNERYRFSVVLPAEFQYYQTQSRENIDYNDIEFYVPTNDTKYLQEVPGYAKVVVVRMYKKDFWEKVKNDEDFSMYRQIGQKDGFVYTVSFWDTEPSDWQNKLSEDSKEEIVKSLEL